MSDPADLFIASHTACPVLHAPTPELRATRLTLAGATAVTLCAVVEDLMGIEMPERM